MPAHGLQLLRVLAVAVALSVQASAPGTAVAAGNDEMAGALALPFDVTSTADNTQFTREAGEPLTVGPGAPPPGCDYIASTAWWSVTGNGEQITVSTAGSAPDTAIAAYKVAAGPSEPTAAPSNANRVACNNDTGGTLQSAMSFGSDRGARYLVQVGGANPCASTGGGTTECEDVGALKVRASALRPHNDDRAAAASISSGHPTELDDNVGATSEPSEILDCAGRRYSATIWYRWTAPAEGDAVFSATAAYTNVLPPNNSDTVLALYREGEVAPLACNDDLGATGGPSRLSLRLPAGTYVVQVGAHGIDGETLVGQGPVTTQVDFTADGDLDDDGSAPPADCDDHDPVRHPGAVDVLGDGIDQDCSGADAVDLDKDRDGFLVAQDCRDDSADIHPGARDLPGDGINQDCVGGDAPYPRMGARVSAFFLVYADGTEFSSLRVSAVPAGARIALRCRGRGCPFRHKRRSFSAARPRVSFFSLVKGARLRKGAEVTLRITRAKTLGLFTQWRFRAPRIPKRTTRCLMPGKRKPVRCLI